MLDVLIATVIFVHIQRKLKILFINYHKIKLNVLYKVVRSSSWNLWFYILYLCPKHIDTYINVALSIDDMVNTLLFCWIADEIMCIHLTKLSFN